MPNNYSTGRGYDLGIDAILGRMAHVKPRSIFGYNPSVDIAAAEDIWAGGGIYPWQTVADTYIIAAGGNAADDAGGAGARTITLEILDANYDEATITLTTAGASASAASSITGFRVNRAFVDECGTYGSTNTGEVTVTTSAGVKVAVIPAGKGQTGQTAYTIPRTKVGLVTRRSAHVASAKIASIELLQRKNGDVVAAPFQAVRASTFEAAISGATSETLSAPLLFEPRTDIWMRASVPANNTEVSGDYELYLFDLHMADLT